MGAEFATYKEPPFPLRIATSQVTREDSVAHNHSKFISPTMAVIPITSLAQFNSVVSLYIFFGVTSAANPARSCASFLCLALMVFSSQINAERVALIYFWAYWCGPCRGMTQIFNGFADSGSYPSIDFYRVDIDHAQDVVQHVGGQTVRLVPHY